MTKSRVPFQTSASDHEGESEWLEVTPGERFTIRTSSKTTNGAYVMLEVLATPGNGVPMHVHENEEEHFIVVEGIAYMANGNETLDVAAGSSVTVSKGVPHAWCNRTSSPLRMLVTFTPGRIEGLFRATSERKNNDDLGAIANSYGTRIVGPPLLEGVYTTFFPRSRAG
jgi:mannose-6-phosphate isomerase-like protein (cupin superfamily)